MHSLQMRLGTLAQILTQVHNSQYNRSSNLRMYRTKNYIGMNMSCLLNHYNVQRMIG